VFARVTIIRAAKKAACPARAPPVATAPRTSAAPMARTPVTAVRAHRPVRRAQQGPTIRRPVRSTLDAASIPRTKAPAHSARLRSQIRLTVQPGTNVPSAARQFRGTATREAAYLARAGAVPVTAPAKYMAAARPREQTGAARCQPTPAHTGAERGAAGSLAGAGRQPGAQGPHLLPERRDALVSLTESGFWSLVGPRPRSPRVGSPNGGDWGTKPGWAARYLVAGESVHHINGVRHDIRSENLELWTRPQPAGTRVSDAINALNLRPICVNGAPPTMLTLAPEHPVGRSVGRSVRSVGGMIVKPADVGLSHPAP